MALIPLVAAGLSVGGGILGAKGDIEKGKADRRSAYMQARQLERRGQQAAAQGSREAHEIRRQGKVLESNAKAAQAAGGGSTTDAGSLDIISDISSAVDYNALTALIEGKRRKEDDFESAKIKRIGGDAAAKAGRRRAMSTFLGGLGQGFSSYMGASA